MKVPESRLDPQWSLALAHLLSGYSPVPVLVETADSGSGRCLNPYLPVSQDWVGFWDWICSWLLFPVELVSSCPFCPRSAFSSTLVEFVAQVEFLASGKLWPRLLSLTCICKSWSGFPPAEVPGLELDLERFLVPVYCLGGPRLECDWTFRGPSSGLLPQRSQTHTWVPGSCLFPLTSQTNACTHRGPGSGLLLQRSQTHTWSH